MFNKTKREEKRKQKEIAKTLIEQEKNTRKLAFKRQTRKNAFNLLSQLLQNPYFQDVIVSELDRMDDYSTYQLILHKRDGSTCYLKDHDKDFPDYSYAIYCNLNFRRVYEALTLISYGVLHDDVETTEFNVSYCWGDYYPSNLEETADVYFLCKGFDYLITPYEFSSLTNDILIGYNKILDCIISNNYAEYFGLFLETFSPNKFSEQKQKIEMIMNERGLNSSENPKKEAGIKGEQEVEYALKWLPKEYIVIEKGNGIKLQCKLHGDSVQQEIDHIVVGPSGVILIETKNYSGKIIIDENGNWRRVTEKGDIGEKNPLQQIERHHYVVETILGSDVPIHDIICIANDSSIIEGAENFVVPIIKSDMLAHYIKNLHNENISHMEIENIIEKVKSARI